MQSECFIMLYFSYFEVRIWVKIQIYTKYLIFLIISNKEADPVSHTKLILTLFQL